jgi:hypothetical protein
MILEVRTSLLTGEYPADRRGAVRIARFGRAMDIVTARAGAKKRTTHDPTRARAD